MRPMSEHATPMQIRVKRHPNAHRIDLYLAAKFHDYSRTFIQQLVRGGAVTVNGKPVKPSTEVQKGDTIDVELPDLVETEVQAEDIPLDVVHEDEWLLAINKPADMIVHPARGHQTGTLVNALLHHAETWSDTGGPLRPGIVHRLDRDTSGVILAVKDRTIHHKISRQFQARTIHKRYLAIVEGEVQFDNDVVDLPLGRHLRHREKQAVRQYDGKPAQTVYHVAERFRGFTAVECEPKTGRTHQIRLHMRAIGHPVVCDLLYGKRDACYLSELKGGTPAEGEEPLLSRHALHAWQIRFHHPGTDEDVTYTAPLPADLRGLVAALREHRALPAG